MLGQVTTRTIFIIYLCLFTPSAFSAANVEIENIKSLYAQTNKAIEEGETKQLFYYNTSGGWKTTTDLKTIGFKDVGDDRLLEQAHIFLHHDHVLKALMYIDTPSGDWANKREYYFFDSGKTAFLFETHFTFLGHDFETQKPLPKGPYIVERRIYFDSNGKEIRRLEKAFTSKSKKSVPVRFLQQIDSVYYADVNHLPIYSLHNQSKGAASQ